MIKKTKINFYCSLISEQNYNKKGDFYSFGPNFGEQERPKNVEWVYGGGIQECALKKAQPLNENEVDVTIFTEKDLMSPFVDLVNTKYKIGVINECKEVHPFILDVTKHIEHKFDYIFTNDADLLSRGDKYVFIDPLGANTSFKYAEQRIYEKSKLVSLIASKKGHKIEHKNAKLGGNSTRGHRLRHIIVNFIRHKEYDVDLWGRGYKPFSRHTEALKDYCFSVSIINSREKNYFGSYPLDCFRTGTVPIFWGCPNIGEFFNEKGILHFNTGAEFEKIMESLSVDLYKNMLPHIEDNFQRVQKYNCIDNNLFDTINKTLKLR